MEELPTSWGVAGCFSLRAAGDIRMSVDRIESGAQTNAPDRPNVVVVVLDTARAKDTVPADPSVTPELARLADEGSEYRNAISAAPWTVPSHASLFTGTYPSDHGVHGDHTYFHEELSTLPELFSEAGYETAAVSNNTWITDEFGFDRGFDTFRKGWQYLQSETDIGSVVRAKDTSRKLSAAADVLSAGNPFVNATNLLYSELFQPRGDDGAARATDWIERWIGERSDDRPFFLFANYIEPHIEYRPPREYAEQFLPAGTSYDKVSSIRQQPRAYDVGEYELSELEFELLRALYRGELAYVDDHLSRIRSALENAGEWDDTVLAVLGDHGENVGEHGFLGHQYSLYDTVVHVPLVIHGGAFDGGPDRNDRLVQLPDLAPTLLDEAGIDAPDAREGFLARSFHPDAETDEREIAVSEYVAPQPSMDVLEERFGHVPDELRVYDRSLRALRSDGFKLIRGSDGSRELYHVASDPNERDDISGREPAIVDRLERRLDEWLDSFTAEASSGEVEMAAATEERLRDLGYL